MALKLARIATGLSQEEVAAKLEVHPMTVSRWEREKNPSTPSDADLDKLAVLYDTTKSALRYGDNGAREAPRVALGLPQSIRVWLQEFLLVLTRAGVSEREVDEARRVLTSPELYGFYVGGEPKEYSEEETLEGIAAHGEAIKAVLRRRGYKVPK